MMFELYGIEWVTVVRLDRGESLDRFWPMKKGMQNEKSKGGMVGVNRSILPSLVSGSGLWK